MNCPECNSEMRKVRLKIPDASTPAIGYQCCKCGRFGFDAKSIKKAIDEIKAKETNLDVEQKIKELIL